MAKKKHDADVRAIGRHCRGMLPEEGVTITKDLRRLVAQNGVELSARAKKAPSRADVNKLLHKGELDDAVYADRVGRLAWCLDELGQATCGYDFNDTVMSNPLDGSEYEYECPNCGVEGSYRAPWFEDD